MLKEYHISCFEGRKHTHTCIWCANKGENTHTHHSPSRFLFWLQIFLLLDLLHLCQQGEHMFSFIKCVLSLCWITGCFNSMAVLTHWLFLLFGLIWTQQNFYDTDPNLCPSQGCGASIRFKDRRCNGCYFGRCWGTSVEWSGCEA